MSIKTLLAAAVALLAGAATADAATFCVRAATCPSGIAQTSIKNAIAASAQTAERDEIRLGSGEFGEFVAYSGNGDLRIVGAGRGRTILNPENRGDGHDAVELDGASISDLSIRPRGNFNGTVGALTIRRGV